MNVFQIILPGASPYGFRLSGGDGDAVYVARIRSESKAEQAGLKENDVVLAINGILCMDLSYNSVFGLTELKEPLTLHLMRGEQAQSFWRKRSEELIGQLLKLNEREVVSLLQKKNGNTILIQNNFKPEFELALPIPKARTLSNPTVNTNVLQTSTTYYVEPVKRSPSSTLTLTLVNPTKVDQRKTTFIGPTSFSSYVKPNIFETAAKFSEEVSDNTNWGNTSTSEIQFERVLQSANYKPFENWNSNSFGNRCEKIEIKPNLPNYESNTKNGSEVSFFAKKDFEFVKSKTPLKDEHNEMARATKVISSNLINMSKHFDGSELKNSEAFSEKPSTYSFGTYTPVKNSWEYNFTSKEQGQTNDNLGPSNDWNTYMSSDKKETPVFTARPANIMKLYNVGNLNIPKPRNDQISAVDSPNFKDNDLQATNDETTAATSNPNPSIYIPPPPPAPPIPSDGIPAAVKTNMPSSSYSLLSTIENLKDDEKQAAKTKVQMAKDMALSVLSPANKNSKGQKMFLRRKEMSGSWTISNAEATGSGSDEKMDDRQTFGKFKKVSKSWLSNDQSVTQEGRKLFIRPSQMEPEKVPTTAPVFNVPVTYRSMAEKSSNHFSTYRPISFPNYANTLAMGYCDL